jgi:hypothetical protein
VFLYKAKAYSRNKQQALTKKMLHVLHGEQPEVVEVTIEARQVQHNGMPC